MTNMTCNASLRSVLAYLRILHVKTMFGEYRRGVVACMYLICDNQGRWSTYQLFMPSKYIIKQVKINIEGHSSVPNDDKYGN